MSEMLRCARCGPQPEEAFSVDRRQARGFSYRCRMCDALYRRSRRAPKDQVRSRVPLPVNEARLIEANTRIALVRCGYDTGRAARLLGITRRALQQRMAKWGIKIKDRSDVPAKYRPENYEYGEVSVNGRRDGDDV